VPHTGTGSGRIAAELRTVSCGRVGGYHQVVVLLIPRKETRCAPGTFFTYCCNTPWAILPTIPIEAGQMIIVSYEDESEAKGALKSSLSHSF